jgi:heme o synthase
MYPLSDSVAIRMTKHSSHSNTASLLRYQTVAMAATVLAFVLVLLEGIVRITGPTLGCTSDWYLCTVQPESLWSWTAAVEFGLRGSLTGLVVAIVLLLVHGWQLRRQARSFLVLPVLATLAGGMVALTFSGTSLDFTLSRIGSMQILLALLVVASLIAIVRSSGIEIKSNTGFTQFGWIGGGSAIAVLGLIIAGGAIATSDSAAGACSGWPLCDGQLIPNGFTAVDLHLSHRWVALFATVGILVAATLARRLYNGTPAVRGLINAAAVLIAAQIFIGAVTVWSEQNPVASAAHLGVAGVIWGLLIGAMMLDRMLPMTLPFGEIAPAPTSRPAREIIADYVEFTKPRIMVLLLITTLGGMLIAAAGWPSLDLIFWTMLGGGMSAGGASALNHYIDRDIDGLMSRTSKRPLPSGRVAPVQVAIFGVTLSVLAVYILVVFVNPLAAILALTGNLAYVVMYTKYLKRATPQNIVIGGAAGAMPPLIGWAAVTNSVGVPALILFAVIFYWTPPHFWALALFKRGDYEKARVPMFPEIYGDAETRRHILLYTVMLVIVSIFPFALQFMGLFYLACALFLGGIFLLRAWQLTVNPSDQAARRVFFFSLWYLALIFLAMVIDRMVWFG